MEIKFRSWNPYENVMMKEYFVMNSNGQVLETSYGEISATLIDCKVMQYTGLKDAYGTEIYECDILNFGRDAIGEVKFDQGCFQVGGLLLSKCNTACKVWGNIYENPELLK